MPLLRQDTKESLRSTAKESSIILIYEFIGTAILTTMIGNYMQQQHTKLGQTIPLGERDNTGLLLGMFVCIIFSARISGSHFNPAITISFMIGNVRHGNFDRILGVLYIIAQICGAILGSFLSFILSKNNEVPNNIIQLGVESNEFVQQVILEVMGSFFLVFMYLSSTDPKTKFTKDAAIQTVILAGSYFGAMLLAGTKINIYKVSPVNPAVAFGLVFTNLNAKNFENIWIFCFAPIGGSALALLFFKFIYQRTQQL